MIDFRLRAIQQILGVDPDGIWGPKSQRALADLLRPAVVDHPVIASSFADPADVIAYRKAISLGMSEEEALAVGDNGIGCWKDPTVEGTGPACALPPEDIEEQWGDVDAGKHKQVLVQRENREVVCILKDRMKHRAHLTTRARIDLNPDACKSLGLTPPVMAPVVWSWV